jgi:hypothetical protein
MIAGGHHFALFAPRFKAARYGRFSIEIIAIATIMAIIPNPETR